ncbi:MAG: ribonuclease P protein component [Eubacterium sp.]|nr:ribonuclease P protein component [Eubacterium sp.]
MKYSESLKKNRDFRKVYRRGTSAAERYFVMYVLRNGTDRNRLGISVSKKVGNSVVRHHICRLVRESYRLRETDFRPGYDIILMARPDASGCTQREVSDSLYRLGGRLHVILPDDQNKTVPDDARKTESENRFQNKGEENI